MARTLRSWRAAGAHVLAALALTARLVSKSQVVAMDNPNPECELRTVLVTGDILTTVTGK